MRNHTQGKILYLGGEGHSAAEWGRATGMASNLVITVMVCLLAATALMAGELARAGAGSAVPQDLSGQRATPFVGDASLAADSYQLEPIAYPGARATFVRGINNRGEMAGSYRIIGTRRVLLIKDGTFIPFPEDSILGTNWGEAYGINDRGDVVGEVSLDNGFTIYGFLLSSHDNELTMLEFPGACATHARAINESGTVVGFWEECSEEVFALHGFIWSKGEFSEVDFPGAMNTYLVGINPRGDMLGGWDNESESHNFVLSEGQFLEVDAPFPEIDLGPLDINAAGDLAGAYGDAEGTHGFVWAGDTFTTVEYPGAVSTVVYGINSVGQVVGVYSEGGPNKGFWGQPGNKKKP